VVPEDSEPEPKVDDLAEKQRRRVVSAVELETGETIDHVMLLGFMGDRIWGRRHQILFAVIAIVVMVGLAFALGPIPVAVVFVIAVAALWWLARDSWVGGAVVTDHRIVLVSLGVNKRVRAVFPRAGSTFVRTPEGLLLQPDDPTLPVRSVQIEPTRLYRPEFDLFADAVGGPSA
jgi:hypothetical protein